MCFLIDSIKESIHCKFELPLISWWYSSLNQLTFERKFCSHCCCSSNGACEADSILGSYRTVRAFLQIMHGFIIWMMDQQ